MASYRMAGGMNQSSGSSGVFFQGDGQSQSAVNSSFGNLMGSVAGNVDHAGLNGLANSGTSVAGGSMLADVNSGCAGGLNIQRSASLNAESYNRGPALPMSFSSNNIGVNGMLGSGGSSIAQQGSRENQNIQQLAQGQQQQLLQHRQQLLQQCQQQQGASVIPTLPMSQTGQVPVLGASNGPTFSMSQAGQISLPMGSQVPGSFVQDPNNMYPLHKKARLDVQQEDIMQQQVLQQLLQRQDSAQLQGRSTQLQALLQQQRYRQKHQQLMQSMPQREQLQQQRQLQLKQQLQQHSMQPQSAPKHPSDGCVCARRLMQYLYHQRQRPPDNNIGYWRKFVAEYYSPRARQRWCISSYNDMGQHALGVFPQAAMDAWQCDICGTKSGKGFEATFEVLPRLNEIKFGSGVSDELLYLDMPRECKFPSGMMMLEYNKAVQESVYENLRVVRTGQLRIIFTQDLKILSWEFCTRHHEELISRRSIASQVNQFLKVAQKCQNTVAESGPEGLSQQDLQSNSNMVLAAGRQLAKSLELSAINELGFSKRYVRCLQVAEVVNGMKNLIDFCNDQKVGPIGGLKSFPRLTNASNPQMQKMQEIDQLPNGQRLPTDPNTLNKFMAEQSGPTSQINSTQGMIRGPLGGSAQSALASNYQNMLSRQNSMNSNHNAVHHEGPSSLNTSQSPLSSIQGPASLLPGSLSNLPGSGFPSSQFPSQQPQQLQQHSLNSGSLLKQNPQNSQGNQALQNQQMMQQLLQEMNSIDSGGSVQQPPLGAQNSNGITVRNGVGFGSNNAAVTAATANVSGGVGRAPSRNNSFKVPSNSELTVANGNNVYSQKAPELPQNLHLPEDMVREYDYTDNSLFSVNENMGYGWKP